MTDLTFKRKEAKILTFTIGGGIDVSDPTTVAFAVKDSLEGGTTVISKSNSDFDKTNAATGIVKLPLSTVDLDRVGNFISQLKTTFSASNIDKSDYITIKIEEAIID